MTAEDLGKLCLKADIKLIGDTVCCTRAALLRLANEIEKDSIRRRTNQVVPSLLTRKDDK